ncbi:hypothetical protein [Microbispora sp. NBC_01389]|uniref:hypothetical protein n=1 Tax=Microbispora sp. NBC_01389 TaxID=2903584 RepID=UPI00325280D7
MITIGPVDVDVPGPLPGYRSPDLVTVPGKLAEGGYDLLKGHDILIATEITGKDAITRDVITKRQVYRPVGQCSGVHAGGEGPRGSARQGASVPWPSAREQVSSWIGVTQGVDSVTVA